ncbi:MAG: methyltransferase domain-containing protein [Actinomycetota bacterium]|nr:methyltransferase domain-containing protein [Actinomycetota bacterium]
MPEYALELSEAELFRYQKMAELALSTERELWSAAGIVEGAGVADVGCGPGAVSVVLAQLVGPSGHVWAVDRDAEAREAATAAATRAGVGNVTVGAGDAYDTGLAPGSVDVVMIRHVLAHNGGLEKAIVEHAATLVRPGGCVYLVDVEASSARLRPADPDLEDLNARYVKWHALQGNDLSVGLRLDELLAGAGLEVVHFSGRYLIVEMMPGLRPPSWAAREAMVASGLATADDVARWEAALSRGGQASEPATAFVPSFQAYGRRPAS